MGSMATAAILHLSGSQQACTLSPHAICQDTFWNLSEGPVEGHLKVSPMGVFSDCEQPMQPVSIEALSPGPALTFL